MIDKRQAKINKLNTHKSSNKPTIYKSKLDEKFAKLTILERLGWVGAQNKTSDTLQVKTPRSVDDITNY